MAAIVLGGASAPEPTAGPAEEPVSALAPLDLNFVAEAVSDPGWSAWGEPFANLEDLTARIQSKLEPGQRVRRLAIAAYSAEHTSGFVSFDVGFGGKERIDGLNVNPVRPEVAVKLERLRPYLDSAGLLELRVCGMGQGDHGLRALQAVADIVGVAARGPVEKAAALAPSRGLVLEWLTVFPSVWKLRPVRTNWLETWTDGMRSVEPAYVPIPGEPPQALPLPQAEDGELHFVTRGAAPWMPGGQPIDGITSLVDRALASGRPVKRLIITALARTPYEGFLAFDAAEGESIDGSIREEPGYPHLQVIFPHVRAELERLRTCLAPGAVVEVRAARFAAGESGRRAAQALADLLDVEIRAVASSPAELRASGGLVTRWRSIQPSRSSRTVADSSWRELSDPAVDGPWVPLEAAAYAPVRGVVPPLAIRHDQHPPTGQAGDGNGNRNGNGSTVTRAQEALVPVVVCAGCGRLLDEPAGTPMRVRVPCRGCGSRARRFEMVSPRAARPGPFGRVRSRLRPQR